MKESEKLFQGEKALLWTGIFGMILGLLFGVLVLSHGAEVPPEGDLSKPFSFDLALGLFTVSTAAIVPFASFRNKGRAVWRGIALLTTWYAYAQESIQSLRGINPRFSHHGTPVDQLLSLGFGLVSMTIIALYVILAVKVFRARNSRHLLTLGIRYGLIDAIIGFAAGIWMISLHGRYTGPTGNIIWLHGLAFHGLQAAPLIAWLLEKSRLEIEKARRLLHVSGSVYLMLIVLVGVQTMMGRSLMEISPFTVAAWAALLFYLVMLANAVRYSIENRTVNTANFSS